MREASRCPLTQFISPIYFVPLGGLSLSIGAATLGVGLVGA